MMKEPSGFGEAEDFGNKVGRLLLVFAVNNRVIELDLHDYSAPEPVG